MLRHQEPVRGLHWFPGGRLLMGESFSDAALRKVRKEIGLTAAVCRVLGTWNTLFEQSVRAPRQQASGRLASQPASQPDDWFFNPRIQKKTYKTLLFLVFSAPEWEKTL